MFRSIALAVITLLFMPVVHAETFKEGVSYFRLEQPVRTRNPQKIEVVEVFRYSCPHCYRFDPLAKAWKKTLANDVDFHQLPAIFGSSDAEGAIHARAFFTAQALGVLDNKMHDALFFAIQEQRNPLNTQERMEQLFAANGVPAANFNKAFNSFGVDSQVRQAESSTLSYRIGGTPELIVAGKYRVTGQALGGKDVPEAVAHKKMLEVVDYLIAQERSAKK